MGMLTPGWCGWDLLLASVVWHGPPVPESYFLIVIFVRFQSGLRKSSHGLVTGSSTKEWGTGLEYNGVLMERVFKNFLGGHTR